MELVDDVGLGKYATCRGVARGVIAEHPLDLALDDFGVPCSELRCEPSLYRFTDSHGRSDACQIFRTLHHRCSLLGRSTRHSAHDRERLDAIRISYGERGRDHPPERKTDERG